MEDIQPTISYNSSESGGLHPASRESRTPTPTDKLLQPGCSERLSAGNFSSAASTSCTRDATSFSTVGARTLGALATMDLPRLNEEESGVAKRLRELQRQQEPQQSTLIAELKTDLATTIDKAISESFAVLAADLRSEVREATREAASGQIETLTFGLRGMFSEAITEAALRSRTPDLDHITAVIRSALGERPHRNPDDELADAMFDMRPNSSANSRMSLGTRGSKGQPSGAERLKASFNDSSSSDRSIKSLEQNLAAQVLEDSGLTGGGSFSSRAHHLARRRMQHLPVPVPEAEPASGSSPFSIALGGLPQQPNYRSESMSSQQDPTEFRGPLPSQTPQMAVFGPRRVLGAEAAEAGKTQIHPHQTQDPEGQTPVAVGALCGLALLGSSGFRGSLGETLALLEIYASKRDFLSLWQKRTMFDKWGMFAIWVACVTSLVVTGALSSDHEVGDDDMLSRGFDVLHKIAFSLVCAILLELVFCVLYVCRALSLMVDTFCQHVVENLDLSMAVVEWNILQAVLRKASAAIEYCFIALQAVMAFTMPLLFVDFYLMGARRGAVVMLLPTLFAALGVLRMFAHAAVITDKCSRVPSLINSLSFGTGTEGERQRTVDYIVSSAAGFYVCDVRLNTGLALKFVYGWCVIAFGLATHVFTSDGV